MPYYRLNGGSLQPLMPPLGPAYPRGLSGCFDENGQPLFPSARVLFPRVPHQALLSVLTLLLMKQMVVVIARGDMPPAWVPLLWKRAPWWIALLFALDVDGFRYRKREKHALSLLSLFPSGGLGA